MYIQQRHLIQLHRNLAQLLLAAAVLPAGPAGWTGLSPFGKHSGSARPLVLAPTQDMGLGSFRAHQLPSLLAFLSSTSQKRKSVRRRPLLIPLLKASVAPCFERPAPVYILCSDDACFSATMKELLDSNRVNFLIWRYAVTRFPSPVPIPISSHPVFIEVAYSLHQVAYNTRLVTASLTFET